MFGKHYIHLDLWPNQTVLNLSFGKTLNDHGLTLPPVCGGGGKWQCVKFLFGETETEPWKSLRRSQRARDWLRRHKEGGSVGEQ